MKAYFERLFRYTAWADARTLEALRGAPEAHAEALPLLAHLLAAEHVWLERLRGGEPRHPIWPALDLDQCAALAAENGAGYQAYLESVEEGRLADPVRFRTSQGREFVNTALEILTHVALHGPYHRGQVAKIVGRSRGSVVNTDFIMFTWESDREA